jgi:hypothetical protein
MPEIPRGQRLTGDQPGTLDVGAQQATTFRGADVGQAISRAGDAIFQSGRTLNAARNKSMALNVTDAQQQYVFEMTMFDTQAKATQGRAAIGNELRAEGPEVTGDAVADMITIAGMYTDSIYELREQRASDTLERVSQDFKLTPEEIQLFKTSVATYNNASRQEIAAHVVKERGLYNINQAVKGLAQVLEMAAITDTDAGRAELYKQASIWRDSLIEHQALMSDQARAKIPSDEELVSRIESTRITALSAKSEDNAKMFLDELNKGVWDNRLTLDDKDNTTKTVEGQLQGHRKEAAIKRKEDNDKFLDLVIDGKVSRSDIMRSSLFPEQKAAALKVFDGTISGEERYRRSSEVTRSKLLSLLYTNPKALTHDRLYSLVGSAGNDWISNEDFKFFMGKSAELKRGGRSRAEEDKTIMQLMNDNFKAGVYGETKKPEAQNRYAAQVSDYFAWRESNPDGNGVEYFKKSNIRSDTGWFFQRWLTGRSGEQIISEEFARTSFVASMTTEQREVMFRRAEGALGTYDKWLSTFDTGGRAWTTEELQIEYLRQAGLLDELDR